MDRGFIYIITRFLVTFLMISMIGGCSAIMSHLNPLKSSKGGMLNHTQLGGERTIGLSHKSQSNSTVKHNAGRISHGKSHELTNATGVNIFHGETTKEGVIDYLFIIASFVSGAALCALAMFCAHWCFSRISFRIRKKQK